MNRAGLRAAGAFVLGAAGVLGFAPFELFPLPVVSLALLFAGWRAAATPRAAAALGFAWGLGFFLAGVSWVYVSMQHFGGMPAALAALATLLFCAYLALFPAAAGWLFARLRTRAGALDWLLAAAAWSLAEWLRGWLLTGFPWLAIGYAQTPPSPLAGFAPLVGVHGVGFLSAALAALLAGARCGRRRGLAAGVALLVAAAAGYGLHAVAWTQPAERALTVSLLQGNIEQSLKWKPERLTQSLDAYLDLARRHPADLVILPETALPILFEQLPREYLEHLRAAAGGDVLLGAVAGSGARYFNSALGLTGDGAQRYDKAHLVPFGEFTPPLFAWTLSVLHIPMSDFARGALPQAPLALAGERIAVNICYEDIFGDEIRRGAGAATLLANLSNTAWFGDSLAQPQHLQMARMRALETGRPMLRATNTGMTAVVDAKGELSAALPAFSTGALQARVRGHSGLTPYLRWGDLPVLAACVLVLAGCVLRSGRREKRLI